MASSDNASVAVASRSKSKACPALRVFSWVVVAT